MKNYTIAFLLTIGSNACYATATDTTVEIHKNDKYPTAVLVELQTRQSMIAGLTKDRRYKQLEEAQSDIAKEQAATINDFKDNFTYCPVYYFIDTNIELIRNKQFAGVLLNADRSIVSSQAIVPTDSDYVVVYFGYPTEQAKYHDKVKDTSKYTYNSGEPFGRGLVILNDQLEQINYLYELDYNILFRHKSAKKYSYESKHFNIVYSPCAADFNYKLLHRPARKEDELKIRRRMLINKKPKNGY